MILKKLYAKLNPEYIIRKSILFDCEWYSNQYDIPVKESASHYLNEGYKLGYNPSVLFDSKAYIKYNPDLENVNPLLHYEVYGKKEKRIISSTSNGQERDNKIYLNDLIKYVNKKQIKYSLNKTVTIIIPVYNGYKLLKDCLNSLIKYTNKAVEIIIVDDCSDDQRIKILLGKYNNKNNIHVYSNRNNLGFVQTMNKAMSTIKTDIAIWLNPNTQVCENWVEKLVYPFEKYNNLATTTPFSNSNTIFSFPKFLDNNEMIASIDKVNKAFSRIRSLDDGLDEAFSGSSYCMAINMKAWNDVGKLNEVDIEKCLSTENEWCLRARDKDYKHLLVQNLFIENKNKDENNIFYDEYLNTTNKDVKGFINDDPWKKYRYIASLLLSNNAILYIDLDSEKGISGANDYTKDKLQEFKENKQNVILLRHKSYEDNWYINLPFIDDEIKICFSSFSDIYVLFDIVNIKEIYINNLVFLESIENVIHTICELKKNYHFKLSYCFHDYLAVCPSMFLLNGEEMPCNYTNIKNCKECIKNNSNKKVNRNNIEFWRDNFKELFSYVDKFLFFSNYTKDIVCNIYNLKNNIEVIEHKTLLSKNHTKYIYPENNKELTVAFVGMYSIYKGSKIYEETISELKKDIKVNSIIIGPVVEKPTIKHKLYGKYNRNDLGKILTSERVNLVIFSSIQNETYSYLAQELMELNVPFVCFSCGAQAERIKKYKYKNAEICENINANALKKSVLRLYKRIEKEETK